MRETTWRTVQTIRGTTMNELSTDTQDILDRIYDEAFAISSDWNGNEAGRDEDRANCAEQIMLTIRELKELVSEMENL